MKLGLGTVQFGMPYGILNPYGQPGKEEISKIIRFAIRAGIRVIDTAPSYGDSEQILGECLPSLHPFKIITKTIVLKRDEVLTEHIQQVLENVYQSLQRLKQDSIYGLLIHHADDLLVKHSQLLFEALCNLKKKGYIQKLGVSVYAQEQIERILDQYDIDLIQVPINVFDQRLIQDGFLRTLKNRGIEIHARSVFLQGLLLADPDRLDPYFKPIQEHMRTYRQYIESNGLSLLEASLGFVKQLEEIDVVLTGVQTFDHLKEIVEAYHKPWPKIQLDRFALSDENMINPSLWKRNEKR